MVDTDQVTYIPAAVGFEILTYLPDDKAYYARPVVAWAILAGEGETVRAFPLASGESASLNADPVVCLPTGEIVCGDLEWESLAVWLDHMNTNGVPHAHTGKVSDEQHKAPILALDAFRNKFRRGE